MKILKGAITEMADTETNDEFLNEGGSLAGESGLSDGSDTSGWSGLSSETVSGKAS